MCLVAVLGIVSCSMSDVRKVFVRVGDATDNVYSFDFELADSLTAYDFGFFTTMDRNLWDINSIESSFPMHVVWTSPSGETFSEKVWFVMNDDEKAPKTVRPSITRQSFFSRQYIVDYRSGFQTSDLGMWNVTVTLENKVEGMSGLGICYTNGTR